MEHRRFEQTGLIISDEENRQEVTAHFVVHTLGYSRRFHFWTTDREDAEHTYEGVVRAGADQREGPTDGGRCEAPSEGRMATRWPVNVTGWVGSIQYRRLQAPG